MGTEAAAGTTILIWTGCLNPTQEFLTLYSGRPDNIPMKHFINTDLGVVTLVEPLSIEREIWLNS